MITFNYPYWYVLFCFFLGIGYAVLLYRKEKSFGEDNYLLPWFLGGLRFLSVFILAFLLLEPLIESEDKIIEKPILVIAQDNSESIGLSKDSVFYKKEYAENLKQLTERLSEKYEVKTMSFGSQVLDSLRFDFTAKQTDMASVFEVVENKFYGRNLGGVIIASDGIINKGIRPNYVAKQLKNTVVYTIALGDTTVRKDIVLSSIHNNDLAYKGNDFPIEVSVKANYLEGKKVLVSVWKKGKKLKEQAITFASDNASENVRFILPADVSGKQKYTVKVTELEGELTFLNNTKDFYIQIIENKQDILLLARAPHPDISAIKSVLSKNKNYAVSVQLLENFKGKIKKYSLVILHGLPSKKSNHSTLLNDLIKQNIPLFICVDDLTNYNAINKLKQKLAVIGAKGTTEANAGLNTSFSKFTVSESLRNDLSDYPPLQVPFAGGYKVAKQSNVFLFQNINGTTTNYPLLVFNENEGQKIGFLLGEGIWRWRLFDYLKNNSHHNFDELIQKSVQYLVVKKDKSPFRVSNKEHLLENESVVIDAELYNDSYELVNTPDVLVKIINEKGEEYPSKTMARVGNAYRLNAGMFKAGEYIYVATTHFDGKEWSKKGRFTVEELKVEYLNLVANHSLLYRLATEKNGEMYFPNQLDELENAIYSQENIVPISYVKKSVEDLIKWKWIFFVILTLLAIEWFLRKRNGSY